MIFNILEKELNDIFKNRKKEFVAKPKIILGLSGGPDSLFLFHFLNKLKNENKIDLICVNLDHEWRKESAKDTIFCKNLCQNKKVKFIGAKASELNLKLKFNGSMEEIGRKLRRALFNKVLNEKNADYIALGHHLQDQQETFLFRIIRGTTLSGLTCMEKEEYPYIRPLLNIEKKDILNYLNKNKIEYLQDKTNQSDKYLRNRIRIHVIPELKKIDSRFSKKFTSTLEHLKEENTFLEQLAIKTFNTIFKVSAKKLTNKSDLNICTGNLKEFLNLNIVLQKRILIHWLTIQDVKFNPSNGYLNEILRFLNNRNGGSHTISQLFKIIKKKNQFYIEFIPKQSYI